MPKTDDLVHQLSQTNVEPVHKAMALLIIHKLPDDILEQSYIVQDDDVIIIGDVAVVDSLLHEITVSPTTVCCYVRKEGVGEEEYKASYASLDFDVLASILT